MMDRKESNNIQVDSEVYFKKYDHFRRWVSYWYQIQEVLKLQPKKFLEVGVGNKTVSTYLQNRGLDVTTVDIDPELNPDVVCDVRELSKQFKEDSFDVVLCAEVLEHLPFKDFEKALAEIKKVTRKNVVLTLPNARIPFGVFIKIPKKVISFSLSIPLTIKHKFNGEHYWEINKKGYSKKKVRKKIEGLFNIKREYKIPENSYHRVFILEKR